MSTGAIATECSENVKLGPCSVTHAAQGSCAKGCSLRGHGCYGEYGNVFFKTRALNGAGLRAPALADQEAAAIDGLSGKRPLRLHVVGDCPSNAAARKVAGASERYMDRRGQPVWTYTHAWKQVKRESWGRVSVLASCETAAEVREAQARGYTTALVIPEHETGRLHMRDGVKVLPCRAQVRDDQTCHSCGMCIRDGWLREHGLTIGLEAHGTGKKQVRAVLARKNRS